MAKNFRGIITDFDNTLVLTQDFVKRHLAKTCKKLKIKQPDLKLVEATLKKNLPFEQIFTKLFGQEKGEQVLAAYREDAMETAYTPAPAALELVNSAKEKGIPVIIVSNRTNKMAERLAQAGFSDGDFLKIIEPQVKKPGAGAYNEALAGFAALQIQPENVLVIGDSTDDYQSCPADLRGNFFAVITGPNTLEDFTLQGVAKENVLDTLTGVVKILI